MGSDVLSYLSEVDWADKIISEGVEQNSKKWLLNDVADYLAEEYDIPSSYPSNLSSVKAKELMDGRAPENAKLRNHPPVVAGKSERERKIVFKKVVKDAQKKGYITNFQLSEPWHPKLFMEGEINTFPYQHNSMIVFRGVSRDHFYLGGDDPTGKGDNASKRHEDSVLNLGHWNPGNSFNEDNEDAVWTTFKETASSYARKGKVDGKKGVLLKIQVPTQWVQCGAHDVREVNSLSEIKEEFGSPEAYRKHVKKDSSERCAWLVRPQVPLNFIRKIWDLELFNTNEPSYALPLQSKDSIDGIDLMHFFQKKKLPDQPNFGDAEKHQESWRIVAMKTVMADTKELQDFCKYLINDLRKVEGKEYNMKLVRKVVNEEESINNLVADPFDTAQDLGVDQGLSQIEAQKIEDIEREVKRIYKVVERIEENSENDIANLIAEGQVSEKFRDLISKLYKIQVGDPEKVKAVEELESKNRVLREISNNIVKNFRRMKIMGEKEFYGPNKTISLTEFDDLTEEISEEAGGPSQGINKAVRELIESSNQLGLEINIEEKKVEDLDSLQSAIGHILKISKIIDNRVGETIEDVVSEGETPESLTKPIESIYLINISDEFQENVSNSKERLANELGIIKERLKEGIELVNWFYQMEVRYAEIVKMTQKAIQRGGLKEAEVYDIEDALRSYEKTNKKRYGVRDIIKRARRKLEINKDLNREEPGNIKNLNKAAKKRLKFVQQQKSEIKEVENQLKQMMQQIKNVREDYRDIPKQKLEKEVQVMKKRSEKIMSEDGELYSFYNNIENMEWDYTKYRDRAQKRKQTN